MVNTVIHRPLQIFRTFVCGLAVYLGVVTAGGAAGQSTVDSELLHKGWIEYQFSDKAPNTYTLTDDGSISTRADAGISILYKPVEPEDNPPMTLRWSWRVDQAVPPTDLTKKGGDDRNLSLHIWFPSEPGFFSGIGDFMKGVLGAPPMGRSITYVFGGTAERYERFPHPYLPEDGRIVVLRSSEAELGKWFDEEVDLAKDFRQAFGEEAPQPHYIAISADSDDTQSVIRARIKQIQIVH